MMIFLNPQGLAERVAAGMGSCPRNGISKYDWNSTRNRITFREFKRNRSLFRGKEQRP